MGQPVTSERMFQETDRQGVFMALIDFVNKGDMDKEQASDMLVKAFNVYKNNVKEAQDEIRKIDSYLQAGPGVGYHVIKRNNFVASTETGVNYQEQNFSSGMGTDSVYYRLAELCKWTINSKFSLDQKVEYFPQWDSFGEYKLRIEANLRYWLRQNLFLNVTMIDLYDTMAARGVEANDLQIRSTIGVKF